MQESNSEVAQFKQQQALQEQSALQGLYGFATVANHAIISARMERGAVCSYNCPLLQVLKVNAF